jgi:hypothetical protein
MHGNNVASGNRVLDLLRVLGVRLGSATGLLPRMAASVLRGRKPLPIADDLKIG